MRKSLRRIRIAVAMCIAVSLLLFGGIAFGTFVHQSHTGNNNWQVDFYPTVSGGHYWQMKAPSGGRVRSQLILDSSEPQFIDDLGEVFNGVCTRRLIQLQTGLSDPYQMTMHCESYTSGTADWWMADQNNPNLPSCNQQ